MNSNTIPSMMSGSLANPIEPGTDGVVEIGLLLPTKRAAALLRLARDRHESVGQILRKMIDRELSEAV
jgi:hypothetical protein